MKRGLFAALLLMTSICFGQERVRDVIYMKSGGAAFTYDVFKPATPNGTCLIWIVSGGWYSSHEGINAEMAGAFTGAGITVVEVVHGTQPRYKIADIVPQIRQAIRCVRSHAKDYGINPDKICVSGGSAGGHLSLMAAATSDAGDPAAKDPIAHFSSKVNAVAVFFPPTDFENWGTPGTLMLAKANGAFAFPAFGLTANGTSDSDKAIIHNSSPINYVTKDFPPCLIIHGDSDQLVPVQQSKEFDAKLASLGLDHQLILAPKGDHGPSTTTPEMIGKFREWILKKLG